MRTDQRRGFSLLEIVVVLVVIGIIFAVTIPYLSRLRANNAINAASERLAGEITQAQTRAKAFGVPIPVDLMNNPPPGTNFSTAGEASIRVRQRRTPAEPVTTLSFFRLGPLDQIPLEFTNLSLLTFEDSPELVGTVLEIGVGLDPVTFNPNVTLPIDSNGSFAVPDIDQIGTLIVGRNPDHAWLLEFTQLGKVSRRKL